MTIVDTLKVKDNAVEEEIEILDAIIGESRALNYEEPLLFEQSVEGLSGVDLPDVEGFENRTGQQERGDIALPEVSEPQVVRHFVRLSSLNYSIDSGIFPLGSCTMKHNPRINEKLARLPGFANLHPSAPVSMAQGALGLMSELEDWLKELSGLPAVTLNPAAGAHGEFTGILTIRRAHEAKGNVRKYILVPDSAHGTNPATAAACGYQVKVIPSSAETGKVDLAKFKEIIAEFGEDIAGIMLTNPNTCGLFESEVIEIAKEIHKIGAYFYCDGANFNAIVGKVKPAEFGVDVMHFNLHKTFSTPHGGGGPGSGPIAVCDELKPYLPIPYIIKNSDGSFGLKMEDDKSIGRLKGFQGQFGMFVRALSYMLSHGGDGLKQVAEDAVLNANYIRTHVKDLYRVPFDEYCMHEFLMNDRHQREAGVSTMEIAKTLIEYGIHPMTVYFPLVVNAAMLVEPTETESRADLDRLIAVFRKIALQVQSGDTEAIEEMKHNPVSSPRRRLDEVKAAKELKLKFGD